MRYSRLAILAGWLILACAPLLLITRFLVVQQDIQIKLKYRVYALINVSPGDVDRIVLFEKISDAVKKIAELDQSDSGTLREISYVASGHPDLVYPHFPLQYVDSSGAKITVSVPLFPEYVSASDFKLVTLILGYGKADVPEQQVTEKVDQLIHLIENACGSLASKCAIKRKPLVKIPGSE